jgi:hypothetical protein
MVTRLRPGEMRVYFPGPATPADADPFIGGRSSDGRLRCLAYLRLSSSEAMVIKEVDVMSWDGTQCHIGSTELNKLPLHRWLTKAHADLATRDAKEAKRRRGPSVSIRNWSVGTERGRGREFYRRIAFEYLKVQEEGEPHVQKRLARESRHRLGIELNLTQVRDALTKATRLGFLTRGTRGRSGRGPGLNLYET